MQRAQVEVLGALISLQLKQSRRIYIILEWDGYFPQGGPIVLAWTVSPGR